MYFRFAGYSICCLFFFHTTFSNFLNLDFSGFITPQKVEISKCINYHCLDFLHLELKRVFSLIDFINPDEESNSVLISDIDDIDDDNDGILDATESPECFYTESEFESGNRSNFVTVSSGLDMNPNYNDPQELVDGDVESGASSYAVNFNNLLPIEGSNIYTFEFSAPVELKNIYLHYVNDKSHFINGAIVILKGSNDKNTWINLNSGEIYNQSNTNVTVLNQGSIRNHQFPVVQNSGRYKYYKIEGVSGETWSAGSTQEVYFEVGEDFNPSLNPKPDCLTDTDIDGTLNHKDLDSDGDGCSDSYEAGAITSEQANHSFQSQKGGSGDTNGDGLADILDDGSNGGRAMDGIPDYVYTPYGYANIINACLDSDQDLISDIIDIDDDNDGILNVTESPECFYSRKEVETIESISTGLPIYDNRDVSNAIDGDDATYSAFVADSGEEGDVLFRITPSTPIQLERLEYDPRSWGITSGSDRAKLQGYNGVVWKDLTNNLELTSTTGTVIIENELQPEEVYESFRLLIAAESNYYSGIREIRLVTGKYNPSTHPKESCSADIDKDGIFNHKDLDSDGDGCSDSYEAGAITSEQANHSFQSQKGGSGDTNGDGLADILDDGSNGGRAMDGIPDYVYTPYGYANIINACLDSDQDLISDIIDIDDDNDGILNVTESPECFYSRKEVETIESISTGLPIYDNRDVSNAIDGDDATYSAFVADSGEEGDVLFRITPSTPIQLERLEYDPRSWGITSGSDRAKLQGYNGVVWKDLTNNLELTSTTGTVIIENELQPEEVYESFRLLIAAESNYYSGIREIRLVTGKYNPSTHPKESCSADIDKDGIFNHKDLDSDGDGCSDSYEAGAITSEQANHSFQSQKGGSGDTNGDGLADILDDGSNGGRAMDGIPDYVYTPYGYANIINACLDSDQDLISDIIDIDDDNDGILNVTESPECFYSRKEVETIESISTGLPIYDNRDVSNAIDGDDATYSAFVADSGEEGDVLFRITPSTPIQLERLEYDPRSWGITSGSDRAKLQGYNGVVWKDLTNNLELTSTTGTVIIENELQPEEVYESFRLLIAAESNYYSGIREIRLVTGKYNPSTHPKESCSADIDKDGIFNHKDLDSDGDGCSDSYEAGAITSEQANHSFQSQKGGSGDTNGDGLADILDDGSNGGRAMDGIPDYVYTPYGYANIINACLDSDQDLISDIIDIDDDNDGILNVTESPECFYSRKEVETIESISTGLPIYDNRDVSNAIDGDDATYSAFVADSGEEGDVLFRITPSTPIQLERLEYDPRSWGITNGSDRAKLQGYNGVVWKDLTNNLELTSTTGTVIIENELQPEEVYESFRLLIAAESNYYSGIREIRLVTGKYNPSTHPKESCSADIDKDGIFNHKDLDSDGDGCSDSYEAGAITSEQANHSFQSQKGGSGDTNGDGLADILDDGSNGGRAMDGIPDYVYTPYGYANIINACLDSDQDLISDIIDIDDDNDGILDIIECSEGFQHIPGGTKNLTETLPTGTNTSHALYDKYGLIIRERSKIAPYNVINDFFNIISHTGDSDNEFIFQSGSRSYSFEYYNPFLNKKRLVDSISVSSEPISDGSTLTLICFDKKGSVIFTGIFPDGSTMSVNTTQTLNNSKIHRFIVSGSNNTSAFDQVYVQELSNFVGGCDTDEDGIINSLDLDSDGDGCPDALEGGGSLTSQDLKKSMMDGGNMGSGFSGNPGVDPVVVNLGNTVNSDGVPTIGGSGQSMGSSQMKDTDADGDGLGASCDCYDEPGGDIDADGVPDYADVDTDNDGLLDTIENPNNSEPALDTDKDGIANYMDLDSDNDGISDAIEACKEVKHGMLVHCRLTLDSVAVDSSACMAGVTRFRCISPLNSDASFVDGDTIPDYLDLDSDADGCYDSQETYNMYVTGVNIDDYDPTISIDKSTGLTTNKMCGIALNDENADGVPMLRDKDENICVFPVKDYGDLPEGYPVLFSRQYPNTDPEDSDSYNQPNDSAAVWLGNIIDYEEKNQPSHDARLDGDDEDGFGIVVHAFQKSRTGIWKVTANGNTAGTEVYISLRIDWNRDSKFVDYVEDGKFVREIYMRSIKLGSQIGGRIMSPISIGLQTEDTIHVSYPDYYVDERDVINIKLIGAKSQADASMVSGRITNGEIEDYQIGGVSLVPITLLTFEVEAQGRDAYLSWTTMTEVNNDHFDIERSEDGIIFEKIGEVEGSSTIKGQRKYHFLDVDVPNKQSMSGTVYYRLKQVDVDCGFSYSDIRSLVLANIHSPIGFRVYPNPTLNSSEVFLRGEGLDVILIYDVMGRLIQTHNFKNANTQVKLELQNLISGMYILQNAHGEIVRLAVE